MKFSLLSAFKTFRSLRRSPGAPHPSHYLPVWERRQVGRPSLPERTIVVWTGAQVASMPVLLRETSRAERYR